MRSEILAACDQLVAAVLNGVYQGVIVAVVVGLSLRVFRRTNAATRHAVWFTALVLVISIIPAHCLRVFLEPGTQPGIFAESASPSKVAGIASISALEGAVRADETTPSGSVERTGIRFEESLTPGESPWSEELALPSALPIPFSRHIEAQGLSWAPTRPRRAVGNQTAAMGVVQTPAKTGFHWQAERLLKPVSLRLATRSTIPRFATAALLVVLLATAAVRVTLLIRRLFQLQRLKRDSLPASAELDHLFQDLRRRLAVSRNVELKLSPVHRSAVLAGFLHPVILLPAEKAQPIDMEEADPILRHELAHTRRRDDWANLVQHFIQAAVFFHPAVWWISKQLSLEREIACDDYVLQQGCQPRAYALLLADLAGRINNCPPMLAPGVSTSKSQLQQRINMILNTSRNTSPRLAKTRLGFITSAAALVAILAIYSAPRLVLAQTDTAPPGALPPPPPGAGSADSKPAAVLAGPSTASTPASGIALAGTSSPAFPPGGEADPGPKFKPDTADQTGPSAEKLPAPASRPMPFVAPAPATKFSPSMIGAVQPVPMLGRTPLPEAPRGSSSIEERLERLERMVQSLIAQQEFKHAPGDVYLQDGKRGNKPGYPTDSYRFRALGEREFGRSDQEKLAAEQAKHEAEMARHEAELAKREAEQAKRGTKDLKNPLSAEKERRGQEMFKEATQKQLEALRRARETLQREMEKLDRQIERLEQDRARIEGGQQLHSELLNELPELSSDEDLVPEGPGR